MHVAVIGAGIVGAAVARELVRKGAVVTVFEQRFPGHGTSSTSFAWINSHSKEPDTYHRLNVEGCAEHRRLARESAAPPSWYFETGNLVWADERTTPLLEERVRRLQARGYPHRWLEPSEARALEPDVLLPSTAVRIGFFPEEGYVFPLVLLARLLGEARDHGAVLACPARVEAVESSRGAVTVTLEGGERRRFDYIVSCVGRWTQRLTETAGAFVPLADPRQAGGPAVSFLACTGPVPVRLSRVLTTPTVKMRPDGGGRLVLQNLALDTGADPGAPPGPDSAVASTLLAALGEVLACGRFADIEWLRIGQRSLPADGLPVAGFVDPQQRIYTVATHSGVTLGPLLGRLVAQEVLDETESPLLTGYRPSRFHDSDSDGEVTVTAARRMGEQ